MKKRNNTIRWIIFAAIFAWAFYSLIPSYSIYFSDDTNEINKIKLKSELNDIEQKMGSGEELTKAEQDKFSKFGKEEEFKTLSNDDVEKLNKHDELKEKSLSLGLDLQGGMHLVLEIDYNEMLKKLANQKDKQLEDMLAEADKMTGNNKDKYFDNVGSVFEKNNVSLNKYFGRKGASNNNILSSLDSTARRGVTTTLEVLRNRIDQFGIAEPSIQRRGIHRIIVELPGVKDEERAAKLVNQAAFLEFKIVADQDAYRKTIDKIDLAVRKLRGFNEEEEAKIEDKVAATKTETAKADTSKKGDAVSATDVFAKDKEDAAAVSTDKTDAEFLKKHPFSGLLESSMRGEYAVSEKNKLKVMNILGYNEVRAAMSEYEFVFQSKTEYKSENEKTYIIFLVKKKAELTGTSIVEANAALGSGNTASGGWEVSFELDRLGGKRFAEITGRNVNKRLAIILDGKLNSAPNIVNRIPGGRGQITGSFTADEAKDLAVVLKAGALEAPLEIMEKRVIGPSLGDDSINSGLKAAGAGIILVMIFMIFFYKLSGVFSVIALALNLFLMMGILAYFRGTLTLPGIAGIILTIGMAVDANVLIFERIKEELRDKKTILSAVNAGYERAWTTIFDANITTLIAGVVLYQFGTGPIKGFALTLMIGIVCSMFTAIVVTRLLADLYITKNSKKISI